MKATTLRFLGLFLGLTCLVRAVDAGTAEPVRVSSLAAFVEAASGKGRSIRMEPGLYRMSEYLSEAVLAQIKARVPKGPGRPPVPMLEITGDDNTLDLTGVTIEIDTSLYAKLPRGYTRCIILQGSGNTLRGLTIRNSGANRGSGGNIFTIQGDRNTIEEVILHVFGSFPYGYGDLLGKGGPNLAALQKQSGIRIAGHGNTLRRCKVFSRAFGHCFYIQEASDILLEDCYAEGEMRSTTEMLCDRSGPAFDLGFRTVYENRDGRFLITPGYMKSLVEDGFRTYGPMPRVVLRNCTAVNTRAGFEIGGSEEKGMKTTIESGMALGCERAFLIGSNVVARRCRADVTHGPLLYLRGGKDSDLEIEVVGDAPKGTVHVLATIAGENHRIALSAGAGDSRIPALPIMLGFGMPSHAEMSSPIRPLAAKNIELSCDLPGVYVLTSTLAENPKLKTKGPVMAEQSVGAAAKGAWK